MGKMMKIVCASCKNEWQCMTGCGLSHALLQSVVRELPIEKQDTVCLLFTSDAADEEDRGGQGVRRVSGRA